MKSNLIICLLLTVSFVFTSCKKEEEAATSTDTPKEIVMPRVQSIPAQTYTQQPAQNVAPTQNQPATTSQTLTPNPQVVTKKGMNPPHGQPGHRCDIAVGAPLSSPPGNTTTQPKIGSATTQQIDPSKFTTQTTTQPTGAPAILNPDAAQTTTAPGMNPPHGQAGHQCGIAVGAPLPK